VRTTFTQQTIHRFCLVNIYIQVQFFMLLELITIQINKYEHSPVNDNIYSRVHKPFGNYRNPFKCRIIRNYNGLEFFSLSYFVTNVSNVRKQYTSEQGPRR